MPPATRSPTQRAADVDALERVLPLIQDLQLVGYRRDDRCEYIVYVRGAYSSAKKGSTCNIFTAVPKAFDEQAQADFGAVQDALGIDDLKVERIEEVLADSDRKVIGTTFVFGDSAFVGQNYIYGFGVLGESVEGGETYTRINDHWQMLVDASR